jgi:hypothetical protein
MKPLTALNFYILLIWVGIIAPCASAFGQGEEVEVPAEAIVYTKNGLVKIDLRKLCGVDGVVVGLHMDHLFLATPQFKLDGGILAKIAVNPTGMTRVDVDWLWRWTGAAWVRIPVTPEQLARLEDAILSNRGNRATTCATAVQRVLIQAAIMDYPTKVYSPVTLLRILATSPQSTIMHYRHLLSTVLSRNGLVERVFVGLPLLGIVLKKVNPIFSPASLLGAPMAPLAREIKELSRRLMALRRMEDNNHRHTPCDLNTNIPKPYYQAATAFAGSAYSMFGPNFINYMTAYALLVAGVDPDVAEGAGLITEMLTEAQQSGYLQSVTPFIPAALAAVKSKSLALATSATSGITTLASASSSIATSLVRLGFYSAQSAAITGANVVAHAGRTAITAVGGAVSGTAAAAAGVAGVVVGGGMIAYTEYQWSGIKRGKDDYMDGFAARWQRLCQQGHLFPALGRDPHLCHNAVQRKLAQEEERFNNDLLADNKCPWYAVWCRG